MLDDIYIVQLFRKIVRHSNYGLAVYLIINQILISGFLAMCTRHWYIGALIGVLLNLIVVTAILSPFGEWYLRCACECGDIDHDSPEYKRITAIFEAAHARARALDPNVPEQVDLYFRDDDSFNAFATGRHTICINTGTLAADDEMIYAVFGHELGHLAHRDTDDFALITGGNVFIDGFRTAMRIGSAMMVVCMSIAGIFIGGEEGWFMDWVGRLSHRLTLFIDGLLALIWFHLGLILIRKTSREQEFEADAFSVEIGGGPALIRLFSGNDSQPSKKERGLFAVLEADHPDDEARVARMQAILEEKGPFIAPFSGITMSAPASPALETGR